MAEDLQAMCANLPFTVFRALFKNYELIAATGGTYVVVPAGTLVLTGTSLGDIAMQISELEHPTEHSEPAPWEKPMPQRRSKL